MGRNVSPGESLRWLGTPTYCPQCGRRINSRSNPLRCQDKQLFCSGKVEQSSTVVVCSAKCKNGFNGTVKKKINEAKRCLKRERSNLEMARLQLKAMREYLRSGNPEALQSLPEGFGPAQSSPNS